MGERYCSLYSVVGFIADIVKKKVGLREGRGNKSMKGEVGKEVGGGVATWG